MRRDLMDACPLAPHVPALCALQCALTPAFPPCPSAPAAPAAAPKAAAPPVTGGMEIQSPMSGTFYTAAAPGEPPFVKVGDRIKKGQTVGIVEAMKLMNEIEVGRLNLGLSGKAVLGMVGKCLPGEAEQGASCLG